MRKGFVRSAVPVMMSLLLGLAAAGCGKSTSPSAPSTASSVAPPSGGSIGTATIAGRVASGASPSSIRRMGGTLMVSIVGTSVSAVVDGSGSFTLHSVPSGDQILAFSGNGVDARITITGVSEHEQIHITVIVNGNTAELDEHE